MIRNLVMLVMAIPVVALISITVVGFLSGISNPLPWITLAALIILILIHNKIVKNKYLEWKDSYSVGIESIDNDHKKLIHLINNLQTVINYRTDVQFERQTLEEVIDYTHYHFKREEDFMERFDYPDYLPHKDKHDKMIESVNEYVKAYNDGDSNALESLLSFLKLWLIKHINGTDQEYSEFLISKGVK